MPTLRLRVQKIDPAKAKPEDRMSGLWFARAHIVLAASFGTDKDGTILLSPDCMSATELRNRSML